MRLHDVSAPAGNKKKRRVGRGMSSGYGKTSGRGHNGQKSRSGGGVRPGFEGGQMPLQRALPKRGFTSIFKKKYNVVNLMQLSAFEEGTEVTPELLKEKGIVKSLKDGVRILGKGEIDRPLNIKAHGFSKSAAEKIKAAGGKTEVI